MPLATVEASAGRGQSKAITHVLDKPTSGVAAYSASSIDSGPTALGPIAGITPDLLHGPNRPIGTYTAKTELGDADKMGDWPLSQQPGGEQPSVVPTKGARDAQVQANEDATEVRLGPANVHNRFNLECHLVDRQTYKLRRSAALVAWQAIMA